jgi:hypothetical protein
MLLLDTMMDIDEGVIYNDGDGVNDNDNSLVEQREPSTSTSPSSLPPSALSSSSEISSNKLEGEKDDGVLQTSTRSSNNGDKRVSSREQRPSNRRMQVFAYLSKPGE